jgi:hypothetical protein
MGEAAQGQELVRHEEEEVKGQSANHSSFNQIQQVIEVD